ncbi:hypothetical protein [Deminuibacter soli]|uniref:Uncharacterized protein n=1 Tax=Deminuibacter soli TaxID=2291815 RepID=A0A3E1NCN5_9BACT|nr:hypothetical protein [Deminuibacter soli]RFM25746.1 hypothetical protein DXN05_23220 [Deminuibacter soli]
MTTHGALSVIAGIQPGALPQLTELLGRIEATKEAADGIIPFTGMPDVHFARFVLLLNRTDVQGNVIPDSLSFVTDYDGSETAHLQQLISIGGQGLWQVFSYCANFPAGNYDAAKLQAYLLQHKQKNATFYVGVSGRSVQQIRNEQLLRDEIEQFADASQPLFAGKNPLAIRQQIIEHVFAMPAFGWAHSPEPGMSGGAAFAHWGKLVLVILLVLVLLPVWLPLLIIWVLIVLVQELRDRPRPNVVTKQHLRELTERETGMVQAQFSAVGNLKPGSVRLHTVTFLLGLTNFLAPYLFSKGKLSGIPTVHFARWLIIDDNRQMLFLSNYDGNSESYLRDFINIAAKQLTLLFSHTMGYPETRLMLFGGAAHAREFMDWARCYQTVSQVWYSANKNVSVKNIYTNSAIRNGLYGKPGEEEALKWLRLI